MEDEIWSIDNVSTLSVSPTEEGTMNQSHLNKKPIIDTRFSTA